MLRRVIARVDPDLVAFRIALVDRDGNQSESISAERRSIAGMVHRYRFRREQRAVLVESLERFPIPNRQARERIARELRVLSHSTTLWFQNARKTQIGDADPIDHAHFVI